MSKYYFNDKVISGTGAVDSLFEEIKKYNMNKPLIISDRGVLSISNFNRITQRITNSDLNYYLFLDADDKTKLSVIREAVETFNKNTCDSIIAIGDEKIFKLAKIVGIVSTNPTYKDIVSIDTKAKLNKSCPSIFVSSSGFTLGQSSRRISYTNDEKDNKRVSYNVDYIINNVAINDSQLSATLDKKLIALEGYSLFIHAFETYLDKTSSMFSGMNSLNAISLIYSNLEKYINDTYDIIAQEKLLNATFLTTLATSATSYGITEAFSSVISSHLNISNEEARACIFINLLKYIKESCLKRITDISHLLDVPNNTDQLVLANEVIAKLELLTKNLKINTKLSKYGIKNEQVTILADEILEQVDLKTSPKDLTKEDIIFILNESI